MMNHLLLDCDVACGLWCVAFATFGIHWVVPKSVADLLFGWLNWFWEALLRYLEHCSVIRVEGMQ